MGDYCTNTHVQYHLPKSLSEAGALVSTTEVDAWIAHAERELIGTIAGVGGSSDYTSDTTHALLIIRDWVAIYVSGLVRRAYAAAAGDGQNDDGETEIEGWRELVQDIRSNPVFYIQMLAAAPSTTTNHLAAHCDADDADSATFLITEKF